MKILIYIIAIMLSYSVGVTYYAAPYAKRDFSNYATDKMQSAIYSLNGKPSLKVHLDEQLVNARSEALPPSKDIAELAQQYPASNSDIIRGLLEGKNNAK